MKKIILSLCAFVLGIAVAAPIAHAAFNNDPLDYGTLLVANSTKNPFPGGVGVGGWTPSVSADAGEAVSVQIYYHNTGPNTANDVRLVLSPQSDTPSTVHNFSARVIADGVTVATGSATVYTTSTQSLSFIPGSVNLAPNQQTTGSPVANETALFGSGVSVGAVAPGWPTQGTLIASFRVSNTTTQVQTCQDPNATNYGGTLPCHYPSSGSTQQTQPVDTCVINSFTADQTTVNRGNSTILRWNTTGCTNVQVWPTIGTVNAIDSRTVTPADSTMYTLTASTTGFPSHTSTVIVNVTAATTTDTCYISFFNADNSSIQLGDATTLRWGTVGCARLEIWPTIGATTQATGSSVINPTNSTKYVLNAYGADNTLHSQSVTVNVGATRVTDACAINAFTADTYSVTAGNSSILRWSTSGCSRAEIYPDLGQVNTSGAHSVTPNASTAYVLNAYGADGSIHTQTVTVYVTANNVQPTQPVQPSFPGQPQPVDTCFINSFTADNYTVYYGSYATLSWNTSGCVVAQIAIDGSIASSVNQSGSASVAPSYTTTYTLNAYGQGGTLHTQSLSISVLNNYNYGYNYGYNYNNNNYYNNNTSCSIYNFTADNYTVNSGSQTTLRWNTNGLNSIAISPNYYGYNNQNLSGSMLVTPNVTTTYTLTGYGCGTTYTRSVTVTVATSTTTNTAPQAVTTVATPLTPYSAQLNGLAVPNTTAGTTKAWFEWGMTNALGSHTTDQTINSYVSSNTYSDIVQGLVPDQYYYYRAVVQNQNGISYGDLYRFQSKATTTTTVVGTTTPPVHVIVQGQKTVRNVVSAQSAPSLLSLKVQSNYDRMCVGGSMDYTITYQNVSTQTLSDTVLQIKLPGELDYVSSTNGQYDNLNRLVTISLGDVAIGQQGSVTVHTSVNSSATVGKLVVMTATVVYTNPTTHAQESAIAYSLVTVTNDCPNLLGASVFGFGSFLPTTLLGWLLLILVILALVVLARHLYKKPKPAPTEVVREIR